MSNFKQIAFLFVFQLVFSGLYGQSVQLVDIKTPLALFTDVSTFEAGKKDPILLSQISDLIGATPPGEEISVCVFKFELEPLAQDLINACASKTVSSQKGPGIGKSRQSRAFCLC